MPWIRTRTQFETRLQISFQSASGPQSTLHPEPNDDKIVQAPSHRQQCTVLDSKAAPYRSMSWTQSNSQRLGQRCGTPLDSHRTLVPEAAEVYSCSG